MDGLYKNVLDAILDVAEEKGNFIRSHIMARAYRKWDGSPGKSDTSHYGKPAQYLHFIAEKVVSPKLFAAFKKESGLGPYMDEYTPNRSSPVWVVMESLTDKNLWPMYLPRKHGFHEWKTIVCQRIKDQTGRKGTQQTVNAVISEFKRVFISVMDARCGPAWKAIRDVLPLPSEEVKSDSFAASFARSARNDEGPTANSCVPLAWPGSKAIISHHIMTQLEQIPQGATLVEPFAGSAVISLLFKQKRPDVNLWINDKSQPVCAFHMTVRDHLPFLLDKLDKEGPTQAKWREYKQAILAGSVRDPRLLGWMLFYVTHYSSNHLGVGFNARATCSDTVKRRRFENASKILQGSNITCFDFREVMQQPGFVYADPPYLEKPLGVFYHEFAEVDHRDLCRILNRRQDWVLSYNDHERVRSNYAPHRIEQVNGDLLIMPTIMTQNNKEEVTVKDVLALKKLCDKMGGVNAAQAHMTKVKEMVEAVGGYDRLAEVMKILCELRG